MAGLTTGESQATLDARFPTTGGTDYIAYSVNGTSEWANLARTAIGATGWAHLALRGVAARIYAWEKVDAHRRRLYNQAKVVIPVLVAGGFLAGGTARDVLTVLAMLAGAAVPHLASRNT